MQKLNLLILTTMLSGNIFALSLGDTVNSSTVKAATTTQSTMQLSAKDARHSEYILNKPDSSTTILVNNQGQVYGFKWADAHPDIDGMVGGRYKAEYDAAYAARPKGDHRRLIINTANLSVSQSGLPNSRFNGEMTARNLQPGS